MNTLDIQSNAPAPAPARKTGLSFKAIDAIADGLVPIFRERDQRIAELSARLGALEVFTAGLQKTLEAHSPFEDRGVWQAGATYLKNSGVTWDGGYWIAQRENEGESPGSGSPAWRLAVRRGKHGREGQPGRCVCRREAKP
jgi:hypothetical protein